MSEALVTVNTDAVQDEIAPVVQAANSLPAVRDVESHKAALILLADVMRAETKVKAFFKPMIDAAMEAKRKTEETRKSIITQQDDILAPVLEAKEIIGRKARAFEEEERRVAKLNQEAIDRAAMEAQERQRELDAAMADTEEEAEDALTAPLAPPVTVTVAPAVAKVAGVSARETWSAEVVDKAAFLAWAAKPENNFYANANEVALNSRARAEHADMKIPGVRAVSSLTYTRK